MNDLYVYKDDEGVSQGPYPVSTIVSWVQSGFFDKDRLVRTESEEEAWKPLGEIASFAQVRCQRNDNASHGR